MSPHIRLISSAQQCLTSLKTTCNWRQELVALEDVVILGRLLRLNQVPIYDCMGKMILEFHSHSKKNLEIYHSMRRNCMQ